VKRKLAKLFVKKSSIGSRCFIFKKQNFSIMQPPTPRGKSYRKSIANKTVAVKRGHVRSEDSLNYVQQGTRYTKRMGTNLTKVSDFISKHLCFQESPKYTYNVQGVKVG
jgi:hypothetical protein